MTWEVFLTTKFRLWIDAHSSTNNTFHGSSREVEKSDILLQIQNSPEVGGGDLTCYVFSLEDVTVHLNVTNPDGILTFEKYDQSIFKRVFNALFPIKTRHLLYRFFKDMNSFWWLILFFIDEVFIFRLESVICKKYTPMARAASIPTLYT